MKYTITHTWTNDRLFKAMESNVEATRIGGCKILLIPSVNRRSEEVINFTLWSFKAKNRSLSGHSDEGV